MNTITDTVFMVRPSHFGYNEETAVNNAFQDNSGDMSPSEISEAAIKEFDRFVNTLREKGIEVIVYNEEDDVIRTDSVFPNNWITTHPQTLITYPMYSENRRLERRSDIIKDLEERYGYNRRYYFEHYEAENKFLEGTGSMILDRENEIVYACLSERTNVEILEKFSVLMSYQKIFFHSTDGEGQDIYHTNVMMALGEDFCVVCLESIKNEDERNELVNALQSTRKEIIDISMDQVNQFAGNMIQVKNKVGETFLIMSEQAYKSLTPAQIDKINEFTNILHSPLYTIEKYGGGSARCMIAEIYH